jgi:membrane fusion protein, heavy metal efflux system
VKQTVWIMLVAFSLGLAGCSRKTASEPTAPQDNSPNGEFILPPNSQGVVTEVVGPRPLPNYLEIPAQIAPDPTRVVRVYSPVGGRLIFLKVLPGEVVGKGQTLAVLESSDVSSALAGYATAKTTLQLKRQALERASELYRRGAVALKDFQQAQADFTMAQASLENARQQLTILDISPDARSDRIPVVAPRSGVVLQVSAATGEYSKSLDSSEPLCVLADLSSIWAVGDLLEKDLSYVKVGAPATLTLVAYPGKAWRGRVGLISSTVDPTTRTLRLRVVLRNNTGTLRPGMFGMLKLLRSTHVGFAVPATAVVREGNSSYVYVQRSPGRFAPQAVTLGGPAGDNQVEILSGLRPSETIVTEGAVLLRTGTP